MHFQPSVAAQAVPELLKRSIQIGTPRAWQRSAEAFQQQIDENPLLEEYLEQRFTIELEMARARRHHDQTGRWPNVQTATLAQLRLFAFAAMLCKVHKRLGAAAQRDLAGKVRGGLLDDHGIANIAFELQVAAHLMEHGVDVTWNDVEQGGGFDFLARTQDMEVEVECKTFSGDVGRKIHLRRQYQLGGLIGASLTEALRTKGTFLVDVIFPGRLNGADLDAVASRIVECVASGVPFQGPVPCTVTTQPFSTEGSPFEHWPQALATPRDDVSDFLARRFGHNSRNYIVLLNKTLGVALVSMRSTQPDAVLNYIYRQLKHAASQLTGSRPGIICAHMLDLTPGNMIEIARAPEVGGTPTGLHVMMGKYFVSPDRGHVHAVKFSTPGEVTKAQEITGEFLRTHSRETGPTYVLSNKANKFANDPRMKPFL